MSGVSLRVLLLAPAIAVHARRWAEALALRGVAVEFATQHPDPDWRVPPGVVVHVLPFSGRAGYFANAPAFRRLARRLRPDLVNAHYASGYGTTAALAGHHPTLLSVWGSDVYDFPYESRIAGRLLRWNLGRADRLASTSHAMAEQVRRLVGSGTEVAVTPFGVDTDRFRPTEGLRDAGLITLGTVKTLADKYGIDLLVRAFAHLRQDAGLQTAGVTERLRLLIVGGGPDRAALERLAQELAIAQVTTFAGPVPHDDVPTWLNRLDVYVAPSRRDSESFGVAVIEASSCGVPVIVSDVGGLPEVVGDGTTGVIVPRDDPRELATALAALVLDPDRRAALGQAGRAFVQERYDWAECVDRMLGLYRDVVQDHHTR